MNVPADMGRRPRSSRALVLVGIAAVLLAALLIGLGVWQLERLQWKLQLIAEVDARTAAALRPQLDAARRDAGLPPLPPPRSAASALTVAVKLDPDLASRVRLRGDARVFVIARAPGGPPMPVAVEKHAPAELPFTTTLDDGDSPMPTHKLSQLREVELVARLSASGNAMPQEGDIESAPLRVALPAKGPVELVIGAK